MRILRTLLIALALLAPALVPTGAMASGADVIDDCADDGVIDGRYTDDELREAERELPSDVDEYTDCREAIRGELGGGREGRSGGSGGGGASDPSLVTDSGAVAGSRDDIEALDDLTGGGGGSGGDRGEAPSIDIGGREVSPGAGGKLLGLANSSNELPLSMLSALVLLALMAIGGTVLLVRRRGLPAPVAARLERLPSISAPAFLRRVRLPARFRR
ncbi:MAG: hypothetical protein WD844_11080 [Thermoleophilaceae bacterium]